MKQRKRVVSLNKCRNHLEPYIGQTLREPIGIGLSEQFHKTNRELMEKPRKTNMERVSLDLDILDAEECDFS